MTADEYAARVACADSLVESRRRRRALEQERRARRRARLEALVIVGLAGATVWAATAGGPMGSMAGLP